MIVCKLELLPKEADRALRAWLSHESYHVLVRVVEAKVKQHECEALAAAIASTAHNLKAEASEASMLKARRYQACLDVLNEIRDVPVNHTFETAKLT